MARLPASLSIAIWLVGSIWAVAILAHVFDAQHEIVYAALAFGLLAAIIEWLVLRGAIVELSIHHGRGSRRRYRLCCAIPGRPGKLFGLDFPWGTLIINVTSSFLIGIFAGLLPSSGTCHRRGASF